MSGGDRRDREGDDAKSICPFCGVGCGVRYDAERGNAVGWRAPVNRRGELCPKGVAAYDVVDHDERLTTPLVREGDELVETSWDDAFGRVESDFREILDENGPDALGFFASSGCTNEENYLLQKLARALGTNNVDNCARLCHSSTVAAMRDRFGTGAMTNTVEDLPEADAFLVAGANPAEQHPVIFSSYVAPAVKQGATLIHVDPRENATTRYADHHLAVRPGYDIPLLNAMCRVVVAEGLIDDEFVAARVEGFEEFREWLDGVDVAASAERAGVEESDLRAAARAYAEPDRAAAFTGMGMSQHRCGTANVHALLNLALLAGNVGRRGAGVNPLRGKNNVQGAGDVGALPDVLPGYRDVTDDEARAEVAAEWGFEPPAEPGLTEVEMTHEFGDGIRGAYVVGENIAATEPNANRVADELDDLDLLVVQDVFPTETVGHADVVFPASSWAEKSGTVTNTDRQVQRMRPAAQPPGDARRDLDLIREVAERLTDGEVGGDRGGPEAVFAEMTRVNSLYAGMGYEGIGEESQRWPFPAGAESGVGVLHRETWGDGAERATLEPVEGVEPADEVGDDELVLTTGRVLSHFNSGAVTRRSGILTRLRSEDALQLHPDDAADRGVEEGDSVVVENDRGRVEAIAAVTPAVRSGTAFLTFHFGEPLVNRLTGDALDPVAKIPEYKHSAVRVRVSRSDATGGDDGGEA
ncbi:formate dehydrogenase subunit alpha [Halorussus caseinilyticus]|uniref:formate dehydrogenase subunit alpha n=1 Tax=Halorussus caseinilyticus TaxID=3034025 RepID=UPI0023E8D529|nr:formate dehydrogenase subunit alpha [Halorussus sp. DT72]